MADDHRALLEAEMDRLHDALTDATRAVSEHVETGVTVWRDKPPVGEPPKTIDTAWMDRFRELQRDRDAAEQALIDFYARHFPRR